MSGVCSDAAGLLPQVVGVDTIYMWQLHSHSMPEMSSPPAAGLSARQLCSWHITALLSLLDALDDAHVEVHQQFLATLGLLQPL